jgi:hypothetical protein
MKQLATKTFTTTSEPLFVWRVDFNMTTTIDDVSGCVAMLQHAAECCDNYEQKKKLLVSKAEETFGRLKEVWPKQNDTKPSLPGSSLYSLLANEYYLDSTHKMTMQSSETQHGIRILFLAESHGETPLPVLGKKICLGQFHEPMQTDLLEMLPPDECHGHINLVHCLSYGESWLLNPDNFSKLSKGEQKSVSIRTNQFWRVLAVMAGDCDISSLPTENGNNNYVYDPLLNENYDCSFKHVIGSESSDSARLSCLKHKIRILSKLRERGITLADVCPVPIYSGVGNSIKRTNKKTGKEYTDRARKLMDSEKVRIVKTCWEAYGQHLVEYYQPCVLVVLGIGVEKAIGCSTLHQCMNRLSGIYYGAMIHPSYNKCQGQNGLPPLRDIRDACTMACNKKRKVPIYYSDNCSILSDESDSSKVGVDNECDTMPVQASPPVESNVDNK